MMLSSLNLLIAAGVSVVALISYSSISAIFNAKVQESVSLKLEESSETVSKLNSDLYELSKQLVLNNTEIALKNVELQRWSTVCDRFTERVETLEAQITSLQSSGLHLDILVRTSDTKTNVANLLNYQIKMCKFYGEMSYKMNINIEEPWITDELKQVLSGKDLELVLSHAQDMAHSSDFSLLMNAI